MNHKFLIRGVPGSDGGGAYYATLSGTTYSGGSDANGIIYIEEYA